MISNSDYICMCLFYRFDDFDDAIDEAIEEDFRDLCGEWTIWKYLLLTNYCSCTLQIFTKVKYKRILYL